MKKVDAPDFNRVWHGWGFKRRYFKWNRVTDTGQSSDEWWMETQ